MQSYYFCLNHTNFISKIQNKSTIDTVLFLNLTKIIG